MSGIPYQPLDVDLEAMSRDLQAIEREFAQQNQALAQLNQAHVHIQSHIDALKQRVQRTDGQGAQQPQPQQHGPQTPAAPPPQPHVPPTPPRAEGAGQLPQHSPAWPGSQGTSLPWSFQPRANPHAKKDAMASKPASDSSKDDDNSHQNHDTDPKA